MPIPTDITIQRMGEQAPPRSAAGLFLRYDPSLEVYILVDKNAQDPEQRVVELYGLASTVIRLREIYGLTESQAREAVGRAFHGFGDEINLAWVVRTAMKGQLGEPTDLDRFLAGIPDGLHRAYAHELKAYFAGTKPMPTPPHGVGPDVVQDLFDIFQSFGLRDPGEANRIDCQAALTDVLERFAADAGAVQDVDAVLRLAQATQEEAQTLVSILRHEIPTLGTAILAMKPTNRTHLASRILGLRRLMATVTELAREGFGI